MLIPGKGDIPGFDVIVPHFCGRLFDASLEVRLCSSLSFLHDAFGNDTDFVVVLSGEPQGSIKVRRRGGLEFR